MEQREKTWLTISLVIFLTICLSPLQVGIVASEPQLNYNVHAFNLSMLHTSFYIRTDSDIKFEIYFLSYRQHYHDSFISVIVLLFSYPV